VSTVIVYCVPHCGHARAVLAQLRRLKIPFEQRVLTPEAADAVVAAYHLYGSPILVVDGEVVCGADPIRARLEQLAVQMRRPQGGGDRAPK
jgi:arsenate reductase-like glutaredoxin family protein